MANLKNYILGILFIAAAVIWGMTFNEMCVGDILLDIVGWPAWSKGNQGLHYTPFYGLVFLLPAMYILNFNEPTIISRILWVISLILILFLAIAPLGFVI